MLRQMLMFPKHKPSCVMPGSLTVLVHHAGRSAESLSLEQAGSAGIIVYASRTSACVKRPHHADGQVLLPSGAAASTIDATGACTPAERGSSAALPSSGPAGSSAGRLGAGPAGACEWMPRICETGLCPHACWAVQRGWPSLPCLFMPFGGLLMHCDVPTALVSCIAHADAAVLHPLLATPTSQQRQPTAAMCLLEH